MKTPVGMLLDRKGPNVYSVAPSASVADAVHVMNQHKVGSLIVMEEERVVGMFTERDVLTRIVAAGRNPQSTRVHEVMTAKVVTITPETTVEQVMDIFATKRCRHLPVIADGHLHGLISIGDVSRWLVDSHRAEAEHLRQYIAGGLAN
jgi:CBS domain-containing protein